MIEITWRCLKPKPYCKLHGKTAIQRPDSGRWYCRNMDIHGKYNGRICGIENLRWGRGSKDVPGRLTASYRRNHA